MQLVYLGLFLFLVWLLGLTFLFVFLFNSFKRLLKNTDEKDFVQVFKNVLKGQATLEKEVTGIKTDFVSFQNYSRMNLNKVGLVRFNPFAETGGDNSFSLCLLNDYQSGFVITGLHTRERTRLYLKPIKNLKSEYKLSKEEKDAIEKACRKKA